MRYNDAKCDFAIFHVWSMQEVRDWRQIPRSNKRISSLYEKYAVAWRYIEIFHSPRISFRYYFVSVGYFTDRGILENFNFLRCKEESRNGKVARKRNISTWFFRSKIVHEMNFLTFYCSNKFLIVWAIWHFKWICEIV